MTAVQERRSWWHRTARSMTPDQLLFGQFKLSKAQRAEMYVRGFALSQVALYVGSAIYFLVLQRTYGFHDPNGKWNAFGLKDFYDRFPVHVQNLLGTHWFASQLAPGWYLTARHDFRHFLIGMLVTLMVGSLTIGLSRKVRKCSDWGIFGRLLLAPVAAAPVAAVLIGLFAWFLPHVAHWDVSQAGVAVGGTFGQWLGRGAWQVTLIGIAAGLAMRVILHPAFDRIQLISLEKKLAAGWNPGFRHRVIYGSAYVNRYELLCAEKHDPEQHGMWLGLLSSVSGFLFLVFLGWGIWLNFFSGILPK